MRSTPTIVFLVISATLLAMILAGCKKKSSEEDQIRSLIDQTARAAERHDVKTVLAATGPGLTVTPQNVDRQSVKGALFVAFRQFGEFTILNPRPTVKVEHPTRASAHVPFAIVRKGQSGPNLGDLADDPESWLGALRDLADVYDMQLMLEKTDGEWKVTQVEIQGTRRLEGY